MHELDRKLVTLLRHNARRSISDLAAELGTTRATVRQHLEKLERSGDIVGYTLILKADVHEQPVRGITLVEVEGRSTARVISSLGGLPNVSAIHTTCGKWDLLVEISAESMTDLDQLLGRIRMVPGVTASETNLILATPRSTRARL